LFGLAERDITTVDWSEIAECKNALLRVAEVSEEQNECVQAVAEGDAVTESLSFATSLALKGTVNCLKQSAATTERLVYRMEKRLADIEKAYDAKQQDRINHRLNVLTIVSAIFMPLTLIVGVYGQNFVNIPELQYENAYFIEVGCMAALSFSMLLFFYKAGWLS
jgi:magnesium transporter